MDHDRLFKELLTTFFVEFLELFLPQVAADLESETLPFLDKEIFTDVTSGERHEVDLLVKARFRGSDAFFLIHVENQATADAEFPRRMFRYFARLHEKHALPVYPIALLSYDHPHAQATDHYAVEFPDLSVLQFKFKTIQLNRLNWRQYLQKPNPVASALMTRMQIAPEDRPRVKLECLRMLVTLKLNRAKATLIGTFMNAYLKLSAAETMVYNTEMAAIEPPEREAVMQLTNEWIEQGEAQGRQAIIFRLLRRRFGVLPPAVTERISQLSTNQLDDLGEALLDFQTLSDFDGWAAQHS